MILNLIIQSYFKIEIFIKLSNKNINFVTTILVALFRWKDLIFTYFIMYNYINV
jgi:hypothetical protein